MTATRKAFTGNKHIDPFWTRTITNVEEDGRWSITRYKPAMPAMAVVRRGLNIPPYLTQWIVQGHVGTDPKGEAKAPHTTP